jgi:alpha-2-macroglobulin-like protein
MIGRLAVFVLVLLLATNHLFSADVKKKISESELVSSKFRQWHDILPEDRVYLQTDKPFYSPGETIWYSVFVMDALSMKPSSKSDIVHLELINPKGSIEKSYVLIAHKGIAKGEFQLSTDAPGGLYTIKAFTNWQKNDPDPAFFTKEIQVQTVMLPRLKMKLEFAKKAYGPSDKVTADLTIETNENKPLAQTQFTYAVSVDGTRILEKNMSSDAQGKASVQFDLPAALKSTDGLLNVMIPFDGQTESVSRAIPIVLNKIGLAFYPEGGDLVSDIESVVAFKAKNEFGKGADIEGYIRNRDNKKIVEFRSFHQGMGSFVFTPENGETYTAVITNPKGIAEIYLLPEILPQGYVLSVKEVSQKKLDISILSSRDESMCVFAQIRGDEFFSKKLDVKKGNNHLSIPLESAPAGVAQITLLDSKMIERAERLVFVNKHKQLSIVVKSEKERYLPREKVKLTITATDHTGMRMPGHVALSVCDDQLLSFADDKSSTIVSSMLAEADVKGKIDEPRFYFDSKEPKADKALDLLLLTNGWRRFTWKQILEEPQPQIQYEKELALVQGTIVDNDDKPVRGASVSIDSTNIKTTTDSTGHFTLRNVALYEPVIMTVKKGDMSEKRQIARYDDDLSITIWKNVPRPMAMKAGGGGVGRKGVAGVGFGGGIDDRPEELEKLKMVLPQFNDAPNILGQVNELKKAIDVDKKILVKAPVPLQAKQRPKPLPVLKKKEMQAMKRDMMMADKIMEQDVFEGNENIVYYRAREFAFPDYSKSKEEERTDFRSTIYWNGDVVLGNNGSATIEFYTNDAITSFRAVTEGFSDNGDIGRAEKVFYSQIPVSITAKIPPVAVTNDTMRIPLLIKNNSAAKVDGELSVTVPAGMKQIGDIGKQHSINIQESKLIYITMVSEKVTDSSVFSASFTANGNSDAFSAPMKIISQGFPVQQSFSGSQLKEDFQSSIIDVVRGSKKVSLRAYPSVTSDLLAGIESILREPSGCFEQTSMSSYPNALVLSYLKASETNDDKLTTRATGLLENGYNRLTSFETKEKGYEWFGGAPGHEALTAYGLMQFNDMSKVSTVVDKKMIDRTSEWLLGRRDGKGGFSRNPRALDSYGGADEDITNTYIVYALSEAGRRDLQKELDNVVTIAKEKMDPYTLALVANALYAYDAYERAEEIMKLLLPKQDKSGFWSGIRHSITRSEGISLKLETTSLVCLAIMKSKRPDNLALTNAVKYIVASRSGSGGFGATQSTILCLKAITAYAQFARKTEEPGTIVVLVNGDKVAQKSYSAGEKDAIIIDSLENVIPDGISTISVEFRDTRTVLPYTLAVDYYTWKPQSSKDCKVSLDVKSGASKVKVGQTLRVSTTLTNLKNEGLPMTMVILGLPAGVSAQPWQLKELQEKKVFDFYEINGSSVYFYYRQMKPLEKRTIDIDCKAETPGEYTSIASRAYLYYTNEYKVWTTIGKLSIDK